MESTGALGLLHASPRRGFATPSATPRVIQLFKSAHQPERVSVRFLQEPWASSLLKKGSDPLEGIVAIGNADARRGSDPFFSGLLTPNG